jgi:hypothetical protein
MGQDICDVCAVVESGTRVTASNIRLAAKNGFDPARLELLPKPPGKPNLPLARALWNMLLQQSDSDWNLCLRCMRAANPYLPEDARVTIPEPDFNLEESATTDKGAMGNGRAKRLMELRTCESLFYSFKFAQLVEDSIRLIEQCPECGDAYAYRSFGLLGESHACGSDGELRDLYGLLRDYFRACEGSLATEGATACRLFLRIAFADLVNRIGQSGPGAKLQLQKTGSPCRGAFAILEGNFEKAQQLFQNAAQEPANTTYAHAGIGLLKLFQSDAAGAFEAFHRAGTQDRDIAALAISLQRRLAVSTESESDRLIEFRKSQAVGLSPEQERARRTMRALLIEPFAGVLRPFHKAS